MNAPRRAGNRRIAVVIPCRNEAGTIGNVVSDFRRALPGAGIYVCDNRSTDDTVAAALAAGAVTLREDLPGKGHAVRRLFSEVEADVYLLVDGDSTYDAGFAPQLVYEVVSGKRDMVVAARVAADSDRVYRAGHRWGNRMLSALLGFLFGKRFTDVLSGYRAFSRRFVKSFPALATGFEVETELCVHALSLHMSIAEIYAPYRPRPEHSYSKLNTWLDGGRILASLLVLFRNERPMAFFGAGFLVLAVTALLLGYPVVLDFLRTGLVPRLPTAILATGTMLLAFISLACGLILETVTRGRRELKRMSYLAAASQTARYAVAETGLAQR